MPRLPNVNARKILRILKRHGFIIDYTTGSHYALYHPQSGRYATVPYRSGNLPKGTLAAILKQAGISSEDI